MSILMAPKARWVMADCGFLYISYPSWWWCSVAYKLPQYEKVHQDGGRTAWHPIGIEPHMRPGSSKENVRSIIRRRVLHTLTLNRRRMKASCILSKAQVYPGAPPLRRALSITTTHRGAIQRFVQSVFAHVPEFRLQLTMEHISAWDLGMRPESPGGFFFLWTIRWRMGSWMCRAWYAQDGTVQKSPSFLWVICDFFRGFLSLFLLCYAKCAPFKYIFDLHY